MGGSGTRVYHQICTTAGYTMSRWNAGHSLDCVPLGHSFYNKWIDRYLLDELSFRSRTQMNWTLQARMRVANPIQTGKWGWKNPRSLYLIRYFDQQFPGLRFIHVVRDGRDLAFNDRFPYRKHEKAVLSDDEIDREDAVRKGLHWARLNAIGSGYGESHMTGRYLVSRLEDLCADPEREVGKIFDFLQVYDSAGVVAGAGLVKTPGSLGRWKGQDREVLRRVEDAIRPDLESYGYDLSTTARP